MGILERLGKVLQSYLNSDNDQPSKRSFSGSYAGGGHGDPDYDAAYEELDDFLKGDDAGGKGQKEKWEWADGENKAEENKAGGKQNRREVPPEILADFAELGLTPGASFEDCKEAYKKLLKLHHPDRQWANNEDVKKATEKTARVNTAYDRLEKWFRAGKI